MAVVLSFVPVLLHLGFLAGVAALVLGLITLRRRSGRGLAGTVLGASGSVLALVFGTIYGLAFLSSIEAPTKAATSQESNSESADVAPVEVPDVVGKTVGEATTALKAAGFKVNAAGASATDLVGSQYPAAGSTVDPGSAVALTAAADDGSSASGPAPAGTKFEMTNTNRIDGSTSDYTQWVDGYNDNFTASNEYEQPDANMKYVVLTVHVTAKTAGVDASSAAYDVALAGTDGAVYDSEFLSDVKAMPSVTLGAGQSASGQIAFEVPNSFHGGIVSFGDGSVFVKTN
ncbi:PASTA domain-containing protein [Curtobacterium sp. SP.BCo]|uniref:PASTA domain-containing protein n=1 Tax=Curtobacterium sp. SP.BCo TaxID=3435229 RepID=UPI003F73D827